MSADALAVLDWPDAFAAGPARVGGKGWNLARLARYGLPVADGGVLPVAAHAAWLADAAWHAELDALEAAGPDAATLDAVRARILETPAPPAVRAAVDAFLAAAGLAEVPLAVRSSAVAEDSARASFAGVHASRLNVRGAAAVLDAIAAVYASLWTPQALAYRRRFGLTHRATALAVVLMPLLPAQAAGVAFSCDPHRGRFDTVVINAARGLGEALVGGRVEPDTYVLTRAWADAAPALATCRRGEPARRCVPAPGGGTELVADPAADGPVLPEAAALELARLAWDVADALGFDRPAQDIEWVWDGQAFRLVQARPVTALPADAPAALAGQAVAWSNGNFRDAIPMVQTPLNWSLTEPMIQRVMHTPFALAGYPLPHGRPFARLHAGRAYLAVTRLQWDYHDALGFPPERLNALTGGHQPTITLPAHTPWRTRGQRLWRNLRLGQALQRLRRGAEGHLAAVIARAAHYRDIDWAALDDATLLARLAALRAEAAGDTRVQLLLGSGGATLFVLAGLLERRLPGRGDALAAALLAGQGTITSAEHGYRLEALAARATDDAAARAFFAAEPFVPAAWRELPADSTFRRDFAAFLDAYGHRSVYEVDLRTPRWREDPGYLLDLIRARLGHTDGTPPAARQQALAARAWAELGTRVPRWLHPLLRRLVAQAAREAAQRELAKSALVAWLEPLRAVARTLAQRLAARGVLADADDVHFCTWRELERALGGDRGAAGLAALAADRRAQHAAWEAQTAPDLWLDDAPRNAVAPEAHDAACLRGLGAAAGSARGPARRVPHPDAGVRLAAGEVLVAPSTDPAWTPLFLRAAALVMETGGFLSHGAIVAREFGVPAVVNVPGALARLQDGQMLEVDGDAGEVRRLQAADTA
ncbi:pyruvate,water dikinase [Plasticicumulans lactativorans]|uniref:Pyruvate,water dikinase n=1 Tax=Plasticicumulans lactativorans TaxID=1133106 RepID=A0A4R2LDZ7_9GAMM|nr:PEP/pyruvate-binding domain-containing protein [Plasticicumulans lactativorans]TCO82769.1 pyruvate,water dikinase [Plasticicumulans lactativorans]